MTRGWGNVRRLLPSGWGLGLILFLALLVWRCQEKGSFNPTGPSLRLVFIGNLSANPSILRAGGARSLISGKVVDQQGLPYEGVVVEFRASKGQVEQRDTTNRNGEFSVQYRSGDSSGIDTV
ncbi:MAG: carboxypeptidase-like regulatory domain-containing protein, partial [bacterium]